VEDAAIAEVLGVPWDDLIPRHQEMLRELFDRTPPARRAKEAQFAVQILAYNGGYQGPLKRKLTRRAEQMLRDLAEQGDGVSQRELGQLLMERSKAQEAVVWLTRAVEQGDARAAFDLGCLYECHRGKVRRDLGLSQHYFELSRQMGNSS
jgi:TPR repeat protein